MNIYLASGNIHKRQEFARILLSCTLHLPAEKNIEFEPKENGQTFFDNALIKARYLYNSIREPVLADDSGLCIDALNGEPGIYSARYGAVDGNALSAAQKNMLVLNRMKGIQNRRCRFVCCIVLLLDNDRVYSVQETCEGLITQEPQGACGFGYDPIVYIPSLKKTVAELTAEEKNIHSHRGKAGRAIARFLEPQPLLSAVDGLQSNYSLHP